MVDFTVKKCPHQAFQDELLSQVLVHARPVLKHVANTRSTVYEPHIVLTASKSRTETRKHII